MSPTDINISDWVLVITTLFLGVIAIFGPAFADLFKKRIFSPKLSLSYKHEPPASHKTKWDGTHDVYFFRLNVLNTGNMQVNKCEALIEELWVYDVSGNPTKISSFSPINLRYDERGSQFIDITPNRPIYWSIGHISSPDFQTEKERNQRKFISIAGKEQEREKFHFVIELLNIPFGQPNILAPGSYCVKISLYPENTKPESIYLKISWSGKWQENLEEMFREIVIEEISKP